MEKYLRQLHSLACSLIAIGKSMLDTNASTHMTGSPHMLNSVIPYNGSTQVMIADEAKAAQETSVDVSDQGGGGVDDGEHCENGCCGGYGK
ncbi:hypothetical protein ACH5RR_013269 [Cinchona calisaya]|uniref:Uncharacterized protein n=1 Tax=Cinchona calisaya TaxID=153742 RepID=A0ABD3A372_9GENT